MCRDKLIRFRRLLCRKFCKRCIASLYNIVDSVQIKLCLISMCNRHVFINFNNNFFRRLDNSPHICNLRSKVEITVFIHRSNLEHRNIDSAVIVYPEKWQFTEHHRNVPAATVPVHVSVMCIEMSGFKTYLLIAFCRKVGFKRFLSYRNCAYYRDILKFVCSLGNRLVNVNNGSASKPEVESVSVLYHSGCLICGNQFFLILLC